MAEATIAALSTADHATIRTSSDRLAQLIVAGDFDSVVGLYTENVVFMPPHEPAVRGRTAYRRWADRFPRVSRMSFTIDEIDGRADLAYVRGSYSMTLHPEGAPGPVEDTGKFLEIRKRQADGSWPIASDIFNSDKA